MKFLWIKSELLHPMDKGGRILTFQLLRHLKERHEITYLGFVRPDNPAEAIQLANDYCHRLVPVPLREVQKSSLRFYLELGVNLFSPLPYALQKYVSTEMTEAIAGELSRSSYDVIVCDCLATVVNFSARTSARTVLFQHNVESLIWQRHHENARNFIRRAYFYEQWRRMNAYEMTACHQFDQVIAVSPAERDLLRNEFGARDVDFVPTGVDTEFFKPDDPAARIPNHIVFTGAMDWLPNEDGILWFVQEVLPLIKQTVPDVSVTIVGRAPSPPVLNLAAQHPEIIVTGRVEDIRPFVNSASVYVVPLRIGGGIRLKIFEAMAMRLPVISTRVGAEGLPVRDGADILLADTAEEFAAATIRVLRNPTLADDLGNQALQAVREQYSWKTTATRFAEICAGR